MRQIAYSKTDLTRICADIKRSTLNQHRNGKGKSVSKTSVYSQIATKLGLASSRTLWRDTYVYKEYLDEWYSTFEKELKVLEPQKKNPSIETFIVPSPPNETLADSQTKDYIKELEKMIDVLRIENETLRMNFMGRYIPVDSDFNDLHVLTPKQIIEYSDTLQILRDSLGI